MTLTALLWMVMAWQHAHGITPDLCPSGTHQVYNATFAVIECIKDEPPQAPPPPFDVPPVETDYWKPPLPFNADGILRDDTGRSCSYDGDEKHEQVCLGGMVYKHYRKRTCKDKKRFLLTDELGVPHCLALGKQP